MTNVDSQRIKEIRDNTRAMAEAFGRIPDALAEALELYVSTQTETQNSNLTFEKVMKEIQTQVIEFPDTHQEFVFTRKIEMDGDSITICDWEYKGVKDGEREGEVIESKGCVTCKHTDKEWYEEPCEDCHGNSGYERKESE